MCYEYDDFDENPDGDFFPEDFAEMGHDGDDE